ncbi:MAG: zinc D-Ala-D-Ala carboxypeptidase [Acidobacteriota bacterium]|nr:zinc D-Ala-D-Ala carboxypeptidase [Acidobacteriota bacterium]
MTFDKRKIVLIAAVSLATLASVIAIVPPRPDGAGASSGLFAARTPETPKPTSLVSSNANEVRSVEAADTVATAGTKTVETVETNAVAPSVAESAAQQNRALKDGLNWTFGGKPQRGWAIYVPLIQRLIGTDDDAASAGFAASVARWQKRVGLAASGVLDEATLMRMISTWQARRRKGSTYPRPDELLTVPAAEFWDSSRADDLRQVERQTYAAYKRMLAAAVADSSVQLASRNGELAASEKYLKIISAFRSREYQDRLRKLEPNAGRGALAVNSPHFTGRALDLYVGGEPTITKDSNRALQTQTRAYRWLVRNAERFGFCPYFYEPWHWEYCGQ